MPDSLDELFPPLFVEALAYHEAGHVLMAVLFDAPIRNVAIAERCKEPGFNGHTAFDWETRKEPIPALLYALICVGSEPSEKLAPNFAEFKSLHKKYRHLYFFAAGLRNDINRGFLAMDVYPLMGFAESTARMYFKRDVRDPAEKIVQLNAKNVIAFAEHLRKVRYVEASEPKKSFSLPVT